jgi:hypothetical protein
VKKSGQTKTNFNLLATLIGTLRYRVGANAGEVNSGLTETEQHLLKEMFT